MRADDQHMSKRLWVYKITTDSNKKGRREKKAVELKKLKKKHFRREMIRKKEARKQEKRWAKEKKKEKRQAMRVPVVITRPFP